MDALLAAADPTADTSDPQVSQAIAHKALELADALRFASAAEASVAVIWDPAAEKYVRAEAGGTGEHGGGGGKAAAAEETGDHKRQKT